MKEYIEGVRLMMTEVMMVILFGLILIIQYLSNGDTPVLITAESANTAFG